MGLVNSPHPYGGWGTAVWGSFFYLEKISYNETMNPDNKDFYEYEGSEVWKDIPGWEGFYQVSSHGRIKRMPIEMTYSNGDKHFYSEKLYKLSPSGNGYYVVRLRKPFGKPMKEYVHRIVAMTFLEKQDGCDIVNHLDCDRTNNHIENLEWTTRSGNSKHSIRAHNGEQGAIKMQPVMCVETGNVFECAMDAVEWLRDLTANLKSSAGNIRSAVLGTRPTALGFHWVTAEEEEEENDEQ